MNMQTNTEKLFGVLKQQISIYESILNLSKKKTDVIVAGKVAELENFVKMEQAIVMRVGKLEQQREEIATQLAQSLGINHSSFTIMQIAGRLDKQQQDKLKEYQQKLSNILESLKEVNNLNSKLIQKSLEYIEFSMNIMTSNESSGNEYENKGNTRKIQNTNRLFDARM